MTIGPMPFLAHVERAAALQVTTPPRPWNPEDVALPTLYVSHGAWVPLSAMYPDAAIPVLQLSMPTHDAARLLALGARLRSLREHGVLIIGSGFMTHGLPFVQWHRPDAVPGWSAAFDDWAAFREHAPGMPYAHPTVEHFTPIFVTLGAATDPTAPVTTAIDGFWLGLAKRSFQVA